MYRWIGSRAVSPLTRRRRRASGEEGFTLLEVLIAFAVLALMLVPILQIFGGGIGSSQTARGYAMAALLARSKLAELATGATFAEGETSGTFEGGEGYRWRTTIARDTSPISLPETQGPADDSAGQSSQPSAGASAGRGTTSGFGNRLGGSGASGSGFGQSLSGSKGSGFGSGSGSDSVFGSTSGFGARGSGAGLAQQRSGFGSSQQRSGFGSSQQRSGFSSDARSPGSIGSTAGIGNSQAEAASDDLIAYKVTVTVNWGPGSAAITLSTLRLGRQPEAGGTSLE
jgi:type II secretion system protein I